MRKPASASMNVTAELTRRASGRRSRAIAVGAGSRYSGTWRIITMACQAASRSRPNANGGNDARRSSAAPHHGANAADDCRTASASSGARGCGQRTATSSTSRAGRLDSTMTRSDMVTASGNRMGDHEHGAEPRLLALPDADQLLVEHVAGELIERAERLIEQQHVGIAHQRARQRGALLHAARQLMRIGCRRNRRAGPDRACAAALRRSAASTVLPPRWISTGSSTLSSVRPPRQQQRLLEHEAGAQFRVWAGRDLPAGRLDQTGDRP